MKQNARLAAVQAAPVWMNRVATIEKACQLIAEAGSNGADVVGFPENFIPGHPVWFYFHPATSKKSMDLAVRLFQESVEIPGSDVQRLQQAARQAQVTVVVGVTERQPHTTGTLYNTQLVIDSTGNIVGKHQKLVPTIGERLVHTGGRRETQRTFDDLETGPLSALACGENSNPMAVAMIASAYPTVHVASWPNHFIPEYCGMRESSLLASRNIAYMAKCFVISSCGLNSEDMIHDIAVTDDDVRFLRDDSKSGGSCIINPAAEVIAGPMDGMHEGIVYADVDFTECIRGRLVHDVTGHYNRPDVYHLSVNNTAENLVAANVQEDIDRFSGGQVDAAQECAVMFSEASFRPVPPAPSHIELRG